MVIGLQRCCLFSVFGLLLNIGLPALLLKPVVGTADLGAGETCAVGRIGFDGLQQINRRDPVLHGLFDLDKTGYFATKSVGWICH
jgi:hypothetical protein